MIFRWGLPLGALLALALATASVARLTPREELVDPPGELPAAGWPAVAASGLVEAEDENVRISTAVPGLVVAVHVQAGQRVEAGTPLFRLDGRDLTAELATRRAALEVARARLAQLEVAPRPEEVPPREAAVREAEALLRDAQARLARRERILADGATSVEDEDAQRHAVAAAEARLARARSELALLRAGTWAPALAVARAEVTAAARAVERVEADLERLVVRAPRAGTLLAVDVRAGEYAAVGPLDPPLMTLGAIERLHVRVSVDEHEAWRVGPEARAEAHLRGDAARVASLTFVRSEPLMVPKVSVSGRLTERVDTRVRELIYALDPAALPVLPGAELDVFIEAPAGR